MGILPRTHIGEIGRKHGGSSGSQIPSSSFGLATRTSQTHGSSSESTYRIAVTVLLALIIYGSLYPLTWNFDQPKDFIYVGPVSLIDAVENVVLFLPLGWVLSWHGDRYGRRWLHFCKWFLLILVLASVLQWMQKYLPRTPAGSDIFFNIVGHLAGWWIGRLSTLTLDNMVKRHQGLLHADRFALIMLAIWVFAELFPLIPTLDVSTVIAHIKSLWQQNPWQPRRTVAHIGMTLIGLETLAQFLRSASLDPFVKQFAALATLAMLTGKFLVLGQSPGLAVPVGIAGGAVLWWLIDLTPEKTRLLALLVISASVYLVYALAPYEFRKIPTSMQWMPFASALRGRIESVMASIAFEALCFGAIIWSAVRLGALPVAATLSVAALGFGCEWIQRYLPGRTAEITSVFTALLTGWLVAAFSQTLHHRRLTIACAERASSGTPTAV